ncbi:cysteine desulfurase family protein [Oscillospiraceae bacterium PP1C4]
MEQKIAYLDNAATTQVCDAAVDAATRMMRKCFGNPSSLHTMGVSSAREMNAAREAVAELLGCQSECVCFTSGGSEANNLAIFGAAHAMARRGQKLVTTAAEHSSVAASMRRLEEMGWTVTYIKPDKSGSIDPQAFADAVDSETMLVSMMLVNNETGAIFPVEETAQKIRAKNPHTLIHCDGVQAFGKLPLKVSRMDIDLMSVSGHKICAPKGSGALYVKRGVRILPLIYGGGQERGLRSGTENLPMIAALGAACGQLSGHVQENLRRAQGLKELLIKKIKEIDGVCINSPQDSSPYLLNVSVPGYRSETLLHFLESRNVYVSSGSACSKGAASPVLTAMGLSTAAIDSALRFSLIYDSTEEELDMLTQALSEGIKLVAHR